MVQKKMGESVALSRNDLSEASSNFFLYPFLIGKPRKESFEQTFSWVETNNRLGNILTQWRCYVCFRAGHLWFERFTKICLLWKEKCNLYIRLFYLFLTKQKISRLWPIFYVGQISYFSTLKNLYKQIIVTRSKMAYKVHTYKI